MGLNFASDRLTQEEREEADLHRRVAALFGPIPVGVEP
jgi:hypothetical protein